MHLYGICEGKTFAIGRLGYQHKERLVQSQMIWLAILYSTFIVISYYVITLYYRKIGRFDWEVYSNTTVHNRLFGDNYVTQYPKGFLPKRIVDDPSQGTLPSQKK